MGSNGCATPPPRDHARAARTPMRPPRMPPEQLTYDRSEWEPEIQSGVARECTMERVGHISAAVNSASSMKRSGGYEVQRFGLVSHVRFAWLRGFHTLQVILGRAKEWEDRVGKNTACWRHAVTQLQGCQGGSRSWADPRHEPRVPPSPLRNGAAPQPRPGADVQRPRVPRAGAHGH